MEIIELTEEDLVRLLPEKEVQKIRGRIGENLSAVLKRLPQPPEIGIAPLDDKKRVMIRDLKMQLGIR